MKRRIKKTKKSKKRTKKVTRKKTRKKSVKPQPGTSYYRKRLLKMREDILQIVHRKQQEDLPDSEVGDEMDAASNSLERELLFELSDTERISLDNIEAALRRIDQAKFGICEACGRKIRRKRLRAMPQARYCMNCQCKSEHKPKAGIRLKKIMI